MQTKIKSEIGAILTAKSYGDDREAVIRIFSALPESSEALDVYTPSADLGYLALHYAYDWPMVTGSLATAIASTEESATRIIDSLLIDLFGIDEAYHCQVTLVDTRNTLLVNGEYHYFSKDNG